MLETTLTALDKCYNFFDEIKKGTKKESELKQLFIGLSELEYRNKYEIIIDKYIKIFIEGCKHTSMERSFLYRHQNNKYQKKVYDNIRMICGNFLNEHYKYVRLPFWPLYKIAYEKSGPRARSPQEILSTIKEIEDANKRRKTEIKTND